MADFNNEIIDGQSTVADNLGKTNRNFMLLKNLLKTLTSSSDLSSTLNSMMTNISKTYVKTEHIIDNLVSTATNKPVSARQAKLLKDELTQLNQNIANLTQALDKTVKSKKYTEMTVQDVNNANYPFSYETDINFGKQIGLPTDWAFIKHFKHGNNNGYCTQIAYKLAPSNENVSDSLNWSIKIRKSTALEWTHWEEIHTSGSGNLYTITDANDAIENGKIYLCRYQQCRNIPFNNDGMILAFNYNRNLQAGFQIWVSWHDDCICYRSFIGTFRPWKRLTAVNP